MRQTAKSSVGWDITEKKTQGIVEKEDRGVVAAVEEKGSVLGARGGDAAIAYQVKPLNIEPTCFEFITPGLPSDFV